jgi:hypothetical protein
MDKAEQIIEILETISSDEEREEVFGAIKARFCIYCGCRLEEKEYCQCWNDD